jgi:hypothetical protein
LFVITVALPGIVTSTALNTTAESAVLTHQVISPSSVNSLKAKLSFLSTGRIQNSIAPLLVGRLTEMPRTSVLLRSKTPSFIVTMIVTIPFTTILIDEVGDFTIKTG